MDRSTLFFAPLRVCVKKFHAKMFRGNFQKPDRKGGRRFLRVSLIAVLVALVSATIFFVRSYRSYAKLVDERLAHGYLTSRSGVYAAPRTLRRGQKLSAEGLVAALRRAGYIESEDSTGVWNGSFVWRDGAVEIRPNNNESSPSVVRITFDALGRIAELTGDELTLESFTLAPESLTNDTRTK